LIRISLTYTTRNNNGRWQNPASEKATENGCSRLLDLNFCDFERLFDLPSQQKFILNNAKSVAHT
jgi:hypothetical protein